MSRKVVGFVEQEQLGFLSKRHRDPHALTLPTRQFVDGPVGELGGAGCVERGPHSEFVGLGPLLEQLLMRSPATSHEVDDGDPLRSDRRLREQAEPTGHVLGGHLVDQLAVEDHLTTGWLEQPSECLQQRRLATCVRSDDGGDLSVGDGEVEVVDDDVVVVRERHAGGAQRAPVEDEVSGAVIRELRFGLAG